MKKKYSDIGIETPGRGISSQNGNDDLNDDNVLMIYNKVATSYKYTSTSHNLDINSYYKLSIDVKTLLDGDNTDELAGAYITVSGGAEANWAAINTQGEWKTYTLYIETSELTSGTISVVLSNGIGANNSSGHMSKGYAFFDNVVLEKVSEVDEDDKDAVAFKKADYDKVALSDTVAKYSMKTANAEFDFASSTTSVPYTPSKYSLVAGYGSGENASTSSTYTVRGIIDTNNFDKEASSLTHLNNSLQSVGKTLADLKTPEDSVGTRMLYMQNKDDTAFAYRSSVAMNFDTNKYYEVSIWARTYITKGNATIRLTDGTNEDSNGYTLVADSNDKWTKYTFYVQANQFRATSLFLELWLGFGGQDDKDTLAKGAVLFDSLSLKEITMTSEEFKNIATSDTTQKIGLYTPEENMTSISLDDFDIQNKEDAIKDRSIFKKIDANNFTADDYFKENPGMPVIEASEIFKSSVLAINNYLPTSTVLSTLTKPE
ncbi:MAG: hypothetical protein K2J13_01845, partial [Clostridia bacterium]|nr:hypothetical protein [Clostridia bacterium]